MPTKRSDVHETGGTPNRGSSVRIQGTVLVLVRSDDCGVKLRMLSKASYVSAQS
jgi:hypothetical protein